MLYVNYSQQKTLHVVQDVVHLRCQNTNTLNEKEGRRFYKL